VLSPLNPSPCPAKTRADLDYDRVLGALAERCAGPLGSDLARELPFASSRSEARSILAEAAEATKLLANNEPIPIGEVPDIRDAIDRVRVGGVLAGAELRAIANALGSARLLRRFLTTRRDRCPALFAACATDPTLDTVADEIAECFDADGTLSDRASARLRELRSEHQTSRQRMLSRMDDLMTRYEGIIQDRFVTEREGRYVLPVRSDAHERFPGIVHSTSATGATLFVEPRAVVAMGNRLKMLEADVERETNVVLARLSARVADVMSSVEACARAIALADVRAATAKLARDLEMTFPTVVDEPRLELRRARHPLLALESNAVVASDLALASGRAMVVSGPNAGGKTVALKSMGLAALMTRAGLPFPCAEGSTMGLFDIVLTDVGDDQSLQKSLSTFSAHVSNLAGILTETTPGAIVLLDELAGGTDPREGEALAAGILDSLCARGGAVAVTTHYEGLKALALGDARFDNASMSIDSKTMSPTFRLAMGVPGSSSALAIARRYGMPSTVIERAERFLTREDVSFEMLVKKLEDERAALEMARTAAEQREREAGEAKVHLEEEIERARARDRQAMTREAHELVARLQRAKEELRGAQARLRVKSPNAAELKDVARTIERVAAEVAIGGALDPLVSRADDGDRRPLRPDELRRGAKVYVSRLRAEAEVIERLPDGNVRVAAGSMKLVVAPSELASPKEDEPVSPAKGSTKSRIAGRAHRDDTVIPTEDNSCDLRGMRADDAVSLATTFLDRSLNEGRGVAFLIHGHGTGALREAVRESLGRSPYVAKFRPGESGEGGDGVTVVWLA
jgi:DNA mismatch repair protein MutS2